MNSAETAVMAVRDQMPRTVRSVTHAAGLLKALHKTGRPTGLSDLARRVGLSKPATFALLRTLELSGLISRDPSAHYQLGWGLYELGSAVARSTELMNIARMELDRLAEATGESVLLGILDSASVLYLDRGQPDSPPAMIANSGRRSPLHTTASGKVLLAHQQSSYIDSLLSTGLVATTSRTITDPAMLKAELARIRVRGYATCWQEQEVGLSSVAVPLGRTPHRVQAALAVVGPSRRFDRTAMPHILGALTSTAAKLSQQLHDSTAVQPC